MSETYASAGVDLPAADRLKKFMAGLAPTTFGPQVLAGPGPFAGLFAIRGFRDPVLVASCDGVGTKVKVASLLGRYETLGYDLVHHSVNDVLTLGAEPLFLLDYIAMGKLEPARIERLFRGLVAACKGVGIALLGGETAEMPGVYREGELDLVGFILGVVERDRVISGRDIQARDWLLGLPSSGLHTNGYSLARKVFRLEEEPGVLRKAFPPLGRTLGEALLEPHRCYYDSLKSFLPRVKALAHITGGGFEGNIPRVLPQGLGARIIGGSWEVPAIFGLIQRQGPVPEAEMHRVFNMGVGMVVVASPEEGPSLLQSLPGARHIGEVIAGKGVEIV